MSDARTRALRPDATVEARAAAAYADGKATAEAGEPRELPFDPDSARAVERVCALMWARGYSAGNPMPTV